MQYLALMLVELLCGGVYYYDSCSHRASGGSAVQWC